MFTALIIVTIFVNTVPSSYCVYSSCSNCPTEPIDKLNDLQIQQIVSQRSVIKEIEQNPQLLSNATYHRSFVTLAPRQNQQILRKYPKIFRDKKSVLTSSSTMGTETALWQICPPKGGSDPLVMVYTEGQLVELVQMPEQNDNQLILDESCQDEFSFGKICRVVDRIVPGLFINLSRIVETGGGSEDFDYSYVVVQYCAAFEP
ncbi:uncharacterized protein [Asterias amurensis]|uniref:uncharacterized protein n=1 Tax=Asterias amurensis TaxID=7602 RepID=UPI003AB59A9C